MQKETEELCQYNFSISKYRGGLGRGRRTKKIKEEEEGGFRRE